MIRETLMLFHVTWDNFQLALSRLRLENSWALESGRELWTPSP